MENFAAIEKNIRKIIREIYAYVQTTFGISAPQQEKMMEEQSSSMMKTLAGDVPSMVSKAIVNTVLTLVYIFLFLYYRMHIKKFILQLVPVVKREKAGEVIQQSTRVSFMYLWGLSQMIFGLWIMYSIGFSIIGVKNPIFFAVLCGTLEIVPFIGNITGTLITILVSLGQGADGSMVAGIIVTYGLIQFIQTYFLEPLVVGHEVHINPMAIIIVLVVGEMIWGIPGMVLSIPLLGMVKVICDNVDRLKPYGFLIGESRKRKGDNWFQKIKNGFSKK
ncbi:MAG TPA: AI-2E family transporter, partial [Chitinophagaceae bacterium]|nr:AI-2E family transporter [Chitinophagaceae bacterium]